MNSDVPQAVIAFRKKIQKKVNKFHLWGKQQRVCEVARDQSEAAEKSATVVGPDGYVENVCPICQQQLRGQPLICKDCLSDEAEQSTTLDGLTPHMEDSCPICQDQFRGVACGAEVLLPCQHVLCKDCSLAWEKCGQDMCPLCRQLIGASADVDGMGCYSTASAVLRQRQEAQPAPPGSSEPATHDLSGRLVFVDGDLFEEIRSSVMEARHGRRARASSAASAEKELPAVTIATNGSAAVAVAMEKPPAAIASSYRLRRGRLLTNPEPGTTFCQNPKCMGCKERRTVKLTQERSQAQS